MKTLLMNDHNHKSMKAEILEISNSLQHIESYLN